MMRKLVPLLLLVPSLAGATYIPGPIQINSPTGVPTGVGYGSTISSVPVSVLNFPASQAVTGPFFQTTQPVNLVQPGSEVIGTTTTLQPSGNNIGIVNIISTAPFTIIQSSNGVNASTEAVTVLNFPATQSISGNVNVTTLYQPGSTVLAASVTLQGTQQLNVGTLYQPGSTVMATSGTITGSLPAGTNVIGTVLISSASGVNGSTIAVTNAGGVALIVNGSGVTQPISGNVGVTTLYQPGSTVLAASVTLQGTQQLNVGTLYQPGSTVLATTTTLQPSSNNIGVVNIVSTNTLTVSGSFASVNITTATPDTALPIAAQFVGGISPTGQLQTFRTDVSSNVMVNFAAGSLTATAIDVTTSAWDTASSGIGAAIAYVGPTGLAQSPRVDISSNTIVIGTVSIQGLAPEGFAAAGNPIAIGVEVASTTMPTGIGDGLQVFQSGSNIGQTLTTGIPWGLITISTYSTTVSSVPANGYAILVASATAGLYNYLCGCVFTNTTATNNVVILESPPNTITDAFPIGVPANDVPSGVAAGCMNPFYRGAVSSQIQIYETATTGASAAIYQRCWGYVGP